LRKHSGNGGGNSKGKAGGEKITGEQARELNANKAFLEEFAVIEPVNPTATVGLAVQTKVEIKMSVVKFAALLKLTKAPSNILNFLGSAKNVGLREVFFRAILTNNALQIVIQGGILKPGPCDGNPLTCILGGLSVMPPMRIILKNSNIFSLTPIIGVQVVLPTPVATIINDNLWLRDSRGYGPTVMVETEFGPGVLKASFGLGLGFTICTDRCQAGYDAWSMDGYRRPKNQPNLQLGLPMDIVIQGSISLGMDLTKAVTPLLEGALDLVGIWYGVDGGLVTKKPFLNLAHVGFEVSVAPVECAVAFPVGCIPKHFLAYGTMCIGAKDACAPALSDNTRVASILGSNANGSPIFSNNFILGHAGMRIDRSNPLNQFFMVKVSQFTLGQMIGIMGDTMNDKFHTLNSMLPSQMKSSGIYPFKYKKGEPTCSPQELAAKKDECYARMSFAFRQHKIGAADAFQMDDAGRNRLGVTQGQVVPAGVVFSGQIQLFGVWLKVEFLAIIDKLELKAHVEMSPIKLGNMLTVSHSLKDTTRGPSFKFYFKGLALPPMLSIDINGAVAIPILQLHVEASLHVGKDGVRGAYSTSSFYGLPCAASGYIQWDWMLKNFQFGVLMKSYDAVQIFDNLYNKIQGFLDKANKYRSDVDKAENVCKHFLNQQLCKSIGAGSGAARKACDAAVWLIKQPLEGIFYVASQTLKGAGQTMKTIYNNVMKGFKALRSAFSVNMLKFDGRASLQDVSIGANFLFDGILLGNHYTFSFGFTFSLQSTIAMITRLANDVYNYVVERMFKPIKELPSKMENEWNKVKNVVGDAINDAQRKVRKQIEKTANAVANAVVDGANAVANGAVDGANAVANGAVKGANAVANGAVDGVNAVGKALSIRRRRRSRRRRRRRL
jgi:hypothetical protein